MYAAGEHGEMSLHFPYAEKISTGTNDARITGW